MKKINFLMRKLSQGVGLNNPASLLSLEARPLELFILICCYMFLLISEPLKRFSKKTKLFRGSKLAINLHVLAVNCGEFLLVHRSL